MAFSFSSLALALVLALAPLLCGAEGTRPAIIDGVVDVTKFGVKPDGESNSAMAFIQPWNAACKSSTGPSKLVIPSGRFMRMPLVPRR
ncbi:hypothetical protein ACSBR2_031733 [Camellia fascicularis]